MGIFIGALILQAVVVTVIVLVLRSFLEKELYAAACEHVVGGSRPSPGGVRRVVLTVASAPGSEAAERLRKVLLQRFVDAEIEILVNADLRGGVVIEAGPEKWDHSLATAIKRMMERT